LGIALLEGEELFDLGGALAIIAQVLVFNLCEAQLREGDHPGDHEMLEFLDRIAGAAVVVGPEQVKGLGGLKFFEDDALVAAEESAVVAEVVRAQKDVLCPERLPGTEELLVVIAEGGNNTEEDVVRIFYLLAPGGMAVIAVDIGGDHHIRPFGPGQACHTIPEKQIPVGEVVIEIFVFGAGVEFQAFRAETEPRSAVVGTDVQILRFIFCLPFLNHLLRDRRIGDTEFDPVFEKSLDGALPIGIHTEVLGMLLAVGVPPVPERMTVTNLGANTMVHALHPAAVLFVQGSEDLRAAAQFRGQKIAGRLVETACAGPL